jgi:hypothetical protein
MWHRNTTVSRHTPPGGACQQGKHAVPEGASADKTTYITSPNKSIFCDSGVMQPDRIF